MNSKPFKTLYHSCFNLKYHLVLVTKYRRKCISRDMLFRLKEISGSICKMWEGELLEFNGESDHIHLLIDLNPKVTPSKFVNNIKTVTSRLIRKEFKVHLKKFFTKPIFWSRTYYSLSCGGAPLSILKQYIQQQEQPKA